MDTWLEGCFRFCHSVMGPLYFQDLFSLIWMLLWVLSFQRNDVISDVYLIDIGLEVISDFWSDFPGVELASLGVFSTQSTEGLFLMSSFRCLVASWVLCVGTQNSSPITLSAEFSLGLKGCLFHWRNEFYSFFFKKGLIKESQGNDYGSQL